MIAAETKFNAGGILKYSADFNFVLSKDIRPKDFFEMALSFGLKAIEYFRQRLLRPLCVEIENLFPGLPITSIAVLIFAAGVLLASRTYPCLFESSDATGHDHIRDLEAICREPSNQGLSNPDTEFLKQIQHRPRGDMPSDQVRRQLGP